MFNLRCTRRLIHHLRIKTLPEPVQTTTALGDWYANDLYVGRQQLVLCTNERCLISVVIPFKPHDTLPARLREAVADLLARIGVERDEIEKEAREMEAATYAKTASRSVLGYMNEFSWQCEWLMLDRGWSNLERVEDALVRTPCDSTPFVFPREETMRIMRRK